jgi:hypothetical protein
LVRPAPQNCPVPAQIGEPIQSVRFSSSTAMPFHATAVGLGRMTLRKVTAGGSP